MLHEEDMCGKGLMYQWRDYGNRPVCNDKLKDDSRRGNSKHRWPNCGRKQGYRGKRGSAHGHYLPYGRQNRPEHRTSMSLRPVNIQGNRAPGMRAPRNTNQFLMHEKYQMMHMRSDSVGTDSGSDCEMDFTDMDSYLGMLENARGGLMDGPNLSPSPSTRFCTRQLARHQQYSFFSFSEVQQEESMQYFPSEDDVMQSEDFMQKDFIEFCNTMTSVAPYQV